MRVAGVLSARPRVITVAIYINNMEDNTLKAQTMKSVVCPCLTASALFFVPSSLKGYRMARDKGHVEDNRKTFPADKQTFIFPQ